MVIYLFYSAKQTASGQSTSSQAMSRPPRDADEEERRAMKKALKKSRSSQHALHPLQPAVDDRGRQDHRGRPGVPNIDPKGII